MAHKADCSQRFLNEGWMDLAWAIWCYNYSWNCVCCLAGSTASIHGAVTTRRAPVAPRQTSSPHPQAMQEALSQRGERLRRVTSSPSRVKGSMLPQEAPCTSPDKGRDTKSFLEKSETWRLHASERQEKECWTTTPFRKNLLLCAINQSPFPSYSCYNIGPACCYFWWHFLFIEMIFSAFPSLCQLLNDLETPFKFIREFLFKRPLPWIIQFQCK